MTVLLCSKKLTTQSTVSLSDTGGRSSEASYLYLDLVIPGHWFWDTLHAHVARSIVAYSLHGSLEQAPVRGYPYSRAPGVGQAWLSITGLIRDPLPP